MPVLYHQEMKKFLMGFIYAMRGLRSSSEERNMRVHFVITWIVIVAGIYCRISRLEWILLLLCIALVLMAEGFNTAIEYLVNLIRDACGVPYANKNLGKAKDIAAGAVLIAAIIAAVIGGIIFWPYITIIARSNVYF